jgi:2-hydroxychromene-2-carboxylate isomerase
MAVSGVGSHPPNFEFNARHSARNSLLTILPAIFVQFVAVSASFVRGRRFKLLMGDLIVLAERRAGRSMTVRPVRSTFHFDLSCPFSYLAAERIERILGDVTWVPVASTVLCGPLWTEQPAVRAHAETCAVAMRLPLVWPDRLFAEPARALRAASYAVELGAGARFVLAAMRLAFCGGFDLEDPETLAEAAAAASMPLRACLAAAGDASRDRPLRDAARALQAAGVSRLPAIEVEGRWFAGERALADAASHIREGTDYGPPLAPAG